MKNNRTFLFEKIILSPRIKKFKIVYNCSKINHQEFKMKYDLEKILSCVKNDEQWIKKLIIGGLFIVSIILLIIIPLLAIPLFPKAFMPLLIVCATVAVLIGISIYGYGLQTGHDYINNSETKLPEWRNLGSHLLVGFKATLGSILFYLPLLFFGAIAIVLKLYLKYKAEISVTFKFLDLCFDILLQIIYLIYTLIYPLFSANFIKNFNPFEFLNVSAAYKLFKNNKMSYLLLVLLIIAMGTLLYISSLLLILTIIGVLLIPFVAMYINIICGILIARFIQIDNETKNLEQN